jgi:hypothetical protein
MLAVAWKVVSRTVECFRPHVDGSCPVWSRNHRAKRHDYYNQHIQRPALFLPSDGYQLIRDPFIEIACIICATRKLKQAVLPLPLISTGLSYLQDYLPPVA